MKRVFDQKFYRYCCELLNQAEVALPIQSDLILEFLEREVDKVIADDWDAVTSEYYYEVISEMGDLYAENEFLNERMFSLREEQAA